MRRSTIVRLFAGSRVLLATVALLAFAARPGFAAEPDPKSYWDVNDVRPGMKGVGQTVMVGTKLEEFGAEVLGVMRGVSPGRDMVLCRLTGCNLEHAGIIQGMSGSPIYIDGKLLGAVAFAWEFGKDPIAGVTPFQQMVEYVRSNDRRIAAEGKDLDQAARSAPRLGDASVLIDGLATRTARPARRRSPVSGGALAGMRPIATPLAASGFSPRALAFLGERLAAAGDGPDGGRGGPRARDPRGGGQAARAGRPAEHRHGHRRLRPVGHRHRHPRRGGPRLRLRPPDVQPRRLRVPDDDRLHPHGLPARQRQHEDGLAAEGRRRDRHRRQHRRRRPDRPQARHDPDQRQGQGRPLLRAAHLPRARSSASPTCCRPWSWPS